MIKKGILKNWNNEKGYGFINNAFCHISKFNGIIDKDDIRDGLEIEYKEEQGNKGMQVGKIISFIKEVKGNEGIQNGKTKENYFMKSYVDSFDTNNLEKSLSLEAFDNSNLYYTNKKGYKEHLLTQIKSNSALRKVYDSYLDTNYNNVKIQIWFARIGYQEKRQLLPNGFLKFLIGVYDKLEKNNKKFKDFLEVFVAYHKYFNPKAK